MLKKYQTLLFDLDNTLLDFEAAEYMALRMLFAGQNMSLTEEIEARYKQLNQGLWESFEKGIISRDQVVNTRFELLFKEYGHDVDGVLLDQQYRSYLEQGNQLIDGAMELLTRLHPNFDIYIVSNGVSKTQHARLRNAGLHTFFKGIFVSEDTGYQKPRREFFDYVTTRIPDYTVENTLIIGDSLSADIAGGKNAGIDTCWFNPERIANATDHEPTYEIHKLEELYAILCM